MKESKTYEFYYDEEGDFLELSFGEPSQDGTTQEIEPGIFVTKDIKKNEITDIGILDFKSRVDVLKRILRHYNLKIPLKISLDE